MAAGCGVPAPIYLQGEAEHVLNPHLCESQVFFYTVHPKDEDGTALKEAVVHGLSLQTAEKEEVFLGDCLHAQSKHALMTKCFLWRHRGHSSDALHTCACAVKSQLRAGCPGQLTDDNLTGPVVRTPQEPHLERPGKT